jgi:hypothetical protein
MSVLQTSSMDAAGKKQGSNLAYTEGKGITLLVRDAGVASLGSLLPQEFQDGNQAVAIWTA